MGVNFVGYLLRETFRSLARNRWMSFASIGTVTVSLFILGAAVLMVLNTYHIASTIESTVEVSVFLDNDLDQAQVEEINREIKKMPEVSSARLVTREEALANLRQQFGEKSRILAGLGEDNPLPDAFRIKANHPDDVTVLAARLEKLSGVERVRYGKGVVEKMFALTRWVRIFGLSLIILLGAAAVFLIATTIRMAVVSRRKEINIMKYVGATNWFIRWPFFFEGMILGLTGALLAVAVLYLTYSTLVDALRNSLAFIPVIMDMQFLLQISAGLLLAGTFLGAIGSVISVHKYLKV